MVAMRRQWRLAEAVGVAGWQARRVAEVVEVVARGEARRLVVVVKVVVGREVMGMVERRRRVVAASAREGWGQWVAVAAGHGDSPEPYR
uniref:Uncharacterized protein n=1 Tax=Arundo donax TaxID=35708 RepID=A0A0A9F7B0_ARUDO